MSQPDKIGDDLKALGLVPVEKNVIWSDQELGNKQQSTHLVCLKRAIALTLTVSGTSV
jgi:hypothetical protein